MERYWQASARSSSWIAPCPLRSAHVRATRRILSYDRAERCFASNADFMKARPASDKAQNLSRAAPATDELSRIFVPRYLCSCRARASSTSWRSSSDEGPSWAFMRTSFGRGGTSRWTSMRSSSGPETRPLYEFTWAKVQVHLWSGEP